MALPSKHSPHQDGPPTRNKGLKKPAWKNRPKTAANNHQITLISLYFSGDRFDGVGGLGGYDWWLA